MHRSTFLGTHLYTILPPSTEMLMGAPDDIGTLFPSVRDDFRIQQAPTPLYFVDLVHIVLGFDRYLLRTPIAVTVSNSNSHDLSIGIRCLKKTKWLTVPLSSAGARQRAGWQDRTVTASLSHLDLQVSASDQTCRLHEPGMRPCEHL